MAPGPEIDLASVEVNIVFFPNVVALNDRFDSGIRCFASRVQCRRVGNGRYDRAIRLIEALNIFCKHAVINSPASNLACNVFELCVLF